MNHCEFAGCEKLVQSSGIGLCAGHTSQYYRFDKDKSKLTALRSRLLNDDPSVPYGFKVCRICYSTKPKDEFHKRTVSSDNKSLYCKPCESDKKRRNTYGITPEDVLTKLYKQNGLCSICFQSIVDSWVVDHDHNTDEVRDLLCNRCNLLIGQADEDPELLRNAADYVWKHQNG